LGMECEREVFTLTTPETVRLRDRPGHSATPATRNFPAMPRFPSAVSKHSVLCLLAFRNNRRARWEQLLSNNSCGYHDAIGKREFFYAVMPFPRLPRMSGRAWPSLDGLDLNEFPTSFAKRSPDPIPRPGFGTTDAKRRDRRYSAPGRPRSLGQITPVQLEWVESGEKVASSKTPSDLL